MKEKINNVPSHYLSKKKYYVIQSVYYMIIYNASLTSNNELQFQISICKRQFERKGVISTLFFLSKSRTISICPAMQNKQSPFLNCSTYTDEANENLLQESLIETKNKAINY